MEKINATSLVEWTAAASAAMVAGTNYSFAACAIPAINAGKDTRIAQQTLTQLYKNGRNRAFPLLLLGSSSALLAWYRSTSTDYRWLYLAGAGTMFSIVPFSIVTMASDTKELEDEDLIERKGEQCVRDTISSLNKKQLIKTFMAVIASDLCFLGILLTR